MTRNWTVECAIFNVEADTESEATSKVLALLPPKSNVFSARSDRPQELSGKPNTLSQELHRYLRQWLSFDASEEEDGKPTLDTVVGELDSLCGDEAGIYEIAHNMPCKYDESVTEEQREDLVDKLKSELKALIQICGGGTPVEFLLDKVKTTI